MPPRTKNRRRRASPSRGALRERIPRGAASNVAAVPMRCSPGRLPCRSRRATPRIRPERRDVALPDLADVHAIVPDQPTLRLAGIAGEAAGELRHAAEHGPNPLIGKPLGLAVHDKPSLNTKPVQTPR
jgi:hypothetical protein